MNILMRQYNSLNVKIAVYIVYRAGYSAFLFSYRYFTPIPNTELQQSAFGIGTFAITARRNTFAITARRNQKEVFCELYIIHLCVYSK